MAAKAEVEDLILRSFLALGAGEGSSAVCHLRFWGPCEGVAQLVRRRLYFAERKLVITVGAADDPSWHNGLHHLEYHTGGKEVIRRELERPVGCCAFPEGALAESMLQEGEAAHLKRHLLGVGRKN